MPEPKKYTVAKTFTDKNGKVWNVGDTYTAADAAETKKQVDARNVTEDEDTNS